MHVHHHSCLLGNDWYDSISNSSGNAINHFSVITISWYGWWDTDARVSTGLMMLKSHQDIFRIAAALRKDCVAVSRCCIRIPIIKIRGSHYDCPVASKATLNYMDKYIINPMDHPVYGLGQWKTTLPCNVVFHWQSPCPEGSFNLNSFGFHNIVTRQQKHNKIICIFYVI